MCFTCVPVAVDCGDSHCIRISRVADPVSTPYETGFDPVEGEHFAAGDWCFVGLVGELVGPEGTVVSSEAVWGIREDDEAAPCAFGFTAGVAWLLERLVTIPRPATLGV